MNLSRNVQIQTGLDHAEGNADRNGEVFDTQGFDGVMIVTKFGDIAAGAVTTFKAQQGEQADLSDGVDLAGTGISVAADDDNQIFVLDIYRPLERYIRGVVDKDGVNATEEMMFYIGYKARKLPTTMELADEVTYELHASPSEGAA